MAFIEENEYKTLTEFAKVYKKKNGEVGVTRAYVYQLAKEEMIYPNTTGIDVLKIGHFYFVRNSRKRY